MAKKKVEKASPGRGDRNKKVPVDIDQLRHWREELQALDKELAEYIATMKAGGFDSIRAVPSGITSAIEVIKTKMVTQIDQGVKKAAIAAARQRAIEDREREKG